MPSNLIALPPSTNSVVFQSKFLQVAFLLLPL
nr:MAG TPA: hypothetical protein [Caudoviricetes sp.]